MRRKLLALTMLLGMAPGEARAEIEGGGFVGAHMFSVTNVAGRKAKDSGETSLNHMATVGIRIGYLPIPRIGIEGEIGVIPTWTWNDQTWVTVVDLRAHLVVNLLTKGRVRPFVAVGGGGMVTSASNPLIIARGIAPQGMVGVGLRVDIGKDWGLRADARVAFEEGTDAGPVVTQDLEFTIGLYGRFPWLVRGTIFDRDLDGITDDADKCPDEAGPMDREGCPPPKPDAAAKPDGAAAPTTDAKPAEGTPTPPAEGTPTPPAEGTPTPPAEGTPTPPAEGAPTPPAEVKPADGQKPSDGAPAPPAEVKPAEDKKPPTDPAPAPATGGQP